VRPPVPVCLEWLLHIREWALVGRCVPVSRQRRISQATIALANEISRLEVGLKGDNAVSMPSVKLADIFSGYRRGSGEVV